MTQSENRSDIGVVRYNQLYASYSIVNCLILNTVTLCFVAIVLRAPCLHYFDPIRWVLARGVPKTPPVKARASAQHEKQAT